MAKGQKSGGRKKGTPNKVTSSVKEAVLETFRNLGGVQHMTDWAEKNPNDYYKLAGRLIPTEIQAELTGKGGAPLVPVLNVSITGTKP